MVFDKNAYRVDKPSWELVAMADYRRGIWLRQNKDKTVLEVCAGREGDDEYVKLTVGEVLTAQQLSQLEGVFRAFRWATEIAMGEDYCLPKGEKRAISTALRDLARAIDQDIRRCPSCKGSGTRSDTPSADEDPYCHECCGTGEIEE